jgi:hypothetical protein
MTTDFLVAPTTHDARPAAPAPATVSATPHRPVAHWVTMTDDTGRDRLTCVWETPAAG